MLEIQEEDGRLYVEIPFATKNDLRSTFPGAKWHPQRKQWSVASVARESLNIWIKKWRDVEVSQSIDDDSPRLEEIQASVNDGRKRIELLTAERAKVFELQKTFSSSLSILENQKDEIEAVEAEIEYEKSEQISKKKEVDEAINRLIDRKIVNCAIDVMKIYERATSKQDREEWNRAQAIVIDARNSLANAQLRLEALDYLSSCRQDRDGIRKMMPGAWYSLEKIKA